MFALLFVLVCGACREEYRRPVPDVSGVVVTPVIKRFDRDLFNLDTLRTERELQRLRAAYPQFAPIFFDQILGVNDPDIAPDGPGAYLNGFLNYPPARRLYDTVQLVYGDFTAQEAQFADALRYFRHYFPERPLPEMTTFISEYSFQNFNFGTQGVATGLDFFLGADYPYQQYNPENPNFSAYLSRHFTPDYLVPKTLLAYLDDLVGNPGGARLLDYMLLNGKKRFLLQQLLPDAGPEIVFEYGPQDLAWIRANEAQFWAYLVENDLLYSTDYARFRKLIEYSPTGNSDMPRDAPGRVANYIGYRVVDQYMRRHPETTLEELLALRDGQQLLQGSRYKPIR